MLLGRHLRWHDSVCDMLLMPAQQNALSAVKQGELIICIMCKNVHCCNSWHSILSHKAMLQYVSTGMRLLACASCQARVVLACPRNKL